MFFVFCVCIGSNSAPVPNFSDKRCFYVLPSRSTRDASTSTGDASRFTRDTFRSMRLREILLGLTVDAKKRRQIGQSEAVFY